MTNTNITAGSRVTANGGMPATVVSVKGRWVKIAFDHSPNTHKNVGFKDVTPIVEKAATSAVRAAKHTCPSVCPVCGSHELWAGRNVKGVVVDEGSVWGCHHCDWSNVTKNGIVGGEARARYVTTKLGDGLVAVDNNDEVATALRGMELDDVYAVAAEVLDIPAKQLRAKYNHLNNGQQRMNLGNRIRKAVRNDKSLIKKLK